MKYEKCPSAIFSPFQISIAAAGNYVFLPAAYLLSVNKDLGNNYYESPENITGEQEILLIVFGKIYKDDGFKLHGNDEQKNGTLLKRQ